MHFSILPMLTELLPPSTNKYSSYFTLLYSNTKPIYFVPNFRSNINARSFWGIDYFICLLPTLAGHGLPIEGIWGDFFIL